MVFIYVAKLLKKKESIQSDLLFAFILMFFLQIYPQNAIYTSYFGLISEGNFPYMLLKYFEKSLGELKPTVYAISATLS